MKTMIASPVWVPVVVAIVTALPATIAAVYAVISHGKIQQLSINVDGRLSELLSLTAKSSKAEGVAQEKAANGQGTDK